MNEVKKDGENSGNGEEEGETAAAKETEEISRKDAEIRKLIRRGEPKEEKQRLKELSKCIKKCIRDKKRVKRQQLIQRILVDFKGVSNIPGVKFAMKTVPLHRLRMNEEESLHHVKGLPMSLVNSTKKNYNDNEQHD